MRRLFALLFGHPATCACGARLRERARRPCPRCGSLSRLVAFALNDAATVDDRVV